MSAIAMVMLHPLTRRSIEMQGLPPACGCRGTADPSRIVLCAYHEGFDDGAEAAAGAVES